MGKGSARRPTDDKRFRQGWDRTFRKAKEEKDADNGKEAEAARA